MPLRISANENIPVPLIERLRAAGHDVMSVFESMRGAADVDVLQAAQRDQRLIVTFDKDFGELAFRSRLPAACGVVLLRLSGSNPDDDNRRAFVALTSREDWQGKFSVIDDQHIRMRPLP
jgi:predicted nuclease of predicted toxin-antitoxin system